jgi:hypothetical protein
VHTIDFFPLPIDEIDSFRSIKSKHTHTHNRTYVIFLYISDVSSDRIYSITLLLLEGKYATPSSEKKCRKEIEKWWLDWGLDGSLITSLDRPLNPDSVAGSVSLRSITLPSRKIYATTLFGTQVQKREIVVTVSWGLHG